MTLTQAQKDQLQRKEEATSHTAQFNPNEHLIPIKNRGGKDADYLPVQWRLVWFRDACPEGTIETQATFLDFDRETEAESWKWDEVQRKSVKVVKHAKGAAVFFARVTDGKGGSATGTKSETAASFPDFIEKAETGAIGRALAALGYGTQFAPELDEEHRIVDSPVNRSATNGSESNGYGRKPTASARPATAGNSGKENGATAEEGTADATATDQQLASIRKLCQHLGKPEPENPETMSYLSAKELITQLSHEYNEQKQRRKAS